MINSELSKNGHAGWLCQDVKMARGRSVAVDTVFYNLNDYNTNRIPFRIMIRSQDDFNDVLHTHDSFQVCYVLKGSCKNQMGEHVAQLVQGDLFSVPPFYEHQISEIPGIAFEFAQIDFMPGFIHESLVDLSKMESFLDFVY